jgi:hypothetical protein
VYRHLHSALPITLNCEPLLSSTTLHSGDALGYPRISSVGDNCSASMDRQISRRDLDVQLLPRAVRRARCRRRCGRCLTSYTPAGCAPHPAPANRGHDRVLGTRYDFSPAARHHMENRPAPTLTLGRSAPKVILILQAPQIWAIRGRVFQYGRGSAFHMSMTFFQDPSGCFRQTVTTLFVSVTVAPAES